MKDQIFRVKDGWNCIVAGRIFGTWACPEYAKAGMQTEQRRHQARQAKQKGNQE
jgi:hypothetical protein